jgi:hypothetical protein
MSSQSTEPTFHRTEEGRLVARLANLAFLALPTRDRSLRVAYATGLKSPPERWTRQDFYGLGRLVDGEAGFRAYVEERAEHRRQLAGLAQRDIMARAETPWGTSQYLRLDADGVVSYSTAGHGGFHLDPAHNALVDELWRIADGWYEEDCEWAKVAATFPELFSSYERACADETLRHSEPDVYERIHGVVLGPGQSRVKDERQFRRDHAADWIVISAINSTSRPGFVECVATLGGDRSSRDGRRYLVPSGEYEIGPFGFVIDPLRHAAYDGPSDFIGWRREHPQR